jgi:DnaK suppressor protein
MPTTEVIVQNDKVRFEPAFLETKRSQLKALREALVGNSTATLKEESELNAGANGEAREFEDDAQKLTTLELEGTLEARDTVRLINVERALRKIDEGTYGVSDVSGEPIPIERLNAVPEAIYTLAEQAAMDQKAIS